MWNLEIKKIIIKDDGILHWIFHEMALLIHWHKLYINIRNKQSDFNHYVWYIQSATENKSSELQVGGLEPGTEKNKSPEPYPFGHTAPLTGSSKSLISSVCCNSKLIWYWVTRTSPSWLVFLVSWLNGRLIFCLVIQRNCVFVSQPVEHNWHLHFPHTILSYANK